MRKLVLLLLSVLLFRTSANAENIHFYDDVYKLQNINNIEKSDTVSNEYFKDGEDSNFWTGMFEVTYFADVNNPIKYAGEADKKIEAEDKCVLLKFIQNKKQDIALISYLENMTVKDKTFFVYNVIKYEKHPKKGLVILKYTKRYESDTTDAIVKMAKEVKEKNNDYMERMIITPVPEIVEK